MYGDAFGSRPVAVTISRPPVVIPGTPATTRTVGGTFFLPPNTTNTALFTGPNFVRNTIVTLNQGFAGTSSPISLPGVQGTFNSLAFVSRNPVTLNSTTSVGTVIPLLPNQTVTNAIQAQAGPSSALQLLQNNGTLLSNTSIYFTTWSVTDVYQVTTPSTPPTVIPQPPINFLVTLPSGGGVVGRTKISDDNSPLPRDRVIFSFDYFNNVPLSVNGNSVYRFSPGFEKTFFDQRASIEVRVPFASTLDANQTVGLYSDRAELGDVNLTLKGLIRQGEVLNVAAGLGIALPTANDVNATLPDGTRLIHVSNDSVVLTPYVAYLLTPNDRLFFQNWLEVSFDTNGNAVEANPNLTGLVPVGRLHDQTILQLDAQLGYWLIRNKCPDRFLNGLAGFVELHYNTSVNGADSASAGAFAIGADSNHLHELNLSAGILAQVRDNLILSIGAVVPLENQPDRSFDYQVGIHASWLFGPRVGTARTAPLSFF
jgi:hypothetical protein